jgi:hypothetical protein
MGNCLSKEPKEFELIGFRCRQNRASSLYQGSRAETTASSLGLRRVDRRDILTPVSDRFPPQASDLVIDKFKGFTFNNNTPYFHNPSAIKSPAFR